VADWSSAVLCRPFRDSIVSVSLPGTPVPSSGFLRPCGTAPVASIGLSGLGQRESLLSFYFLERLIAMAIAAPRNDTAVTKRRACMA
jgi:hypothetical protein